MFKPTLMKLVLLTCHRRAHYTCPQEPNHIVEERDMKSNGRRPNGIEVVKEVQNTCRRT
jgi:hypothetical protein